MMTEPLSHFRPPGTDDGGETKVTAIKPRLEWSLLDIDIKTSPGMDQFLHGVWKRMHDDGSFGMFFHEGPEMTFWQFIEFLSKPDGVLQQVVGFDAEGTLKEHAGFTLLNNLLVVEGCRRALGNFCFFKEYWNRRDSTDMGIACLRDWFEKKRADVIAGSTPRGNPAAIHFIKRLGFVILGEVPSFTIYQGKQCASVVSYMTKEIFKEFYGR